MATVDAPRSVPQPVSAPVEPRPRPAVAEIPEEPDCPADRWAFWFWLGCAALLVLLHFLDIGSHLWHHLIRP